MRTSAKERPNRRSISARGAGLQSLPRLGQGALDALGNAFGLPAWLAPPPGTAVRRARGPWPDRLRPASPDRRHGRPRAHSHPPACRGRGSASPASSLPQSSQLPLSPEAAPPASAFPLQDRPPYGWRGARALRACHGPRRALGTRHAGCAVHHADGHTRCSRRETKPGSIFFEPWRVSAVSRYMSRT